MGNFNPVETHKAAMNFYLKRLGDVRNIPENDIFEGIAFFRNLYKNRDTAHYSSSGRNKLMTLAAHEANNIILGKNIQMKPLPENLEQQPYYEIQCTASGETDIILKRLYDNLNNLENHTYHPNHDRQTLLIIGNKNSTAYRIAEEIKEKGGDIAIIHYETSNKLKDSGNIFDAEGTIAEQQTYTILTSLVRGALYDDISGYHEAIDAFGQSILDLKEIDGEPFEKMIDSYSDALNGSKIYLDGKKGTRLIPEALKIHLDHAGVKAELINDKKRFTDTEIYIPYSRSGKIPLQADSAKRVHPVIAECAKPAMDTKEVGNDNIVWIPDNDHGNVIPREVDLWYQMHLLGDSSIATVQKKHAIRNEILRERHAETLNDSHMFNPTAKA